MVTVPQWQKPFDLLATLWCLPVNIANAPTQMPTDDTIFEQYDWLYNAVSVVDQFPHQYYLILSYTSPVSEDDPTPVGEQMLDEISNAYQGVMVRIAAYASMLSQAEQDALEEQLTLRYEEEIPSTADSFAMEMAVYPEEFTPENILDYAYDFYVLREDAEYFYDFTQVYPQDLEKFTRLSQEFEIAIGINRGQVLALLDERIAQICDLNAVEQYSQLKMELIEQDRCQLLDNTIYVVFETLGDYVDINLKNLETFYAYYALVNGYGYVPPYTAGDVDENGEVSATDALMVLKAVVGKVALTNAQFYAADVNEDGNITAKDALYILQYVVGKLDFLPVYEGVGYAFNV